MLEPGSMSLLADFDARYPGPVLGADEVGTGAWAGPIYVAGAVLPADRTIIRALEAAGLTDSKKLSRTSRERLVAEMERLCVWSTIRWASAAEVDAQGLGPCLNRLYEGVVYDAMTGPGPKTVLIDGDPRPVPWSPTFLQQGDSRSLTIAAASVIAKVARDQVMANIGDRHPEYGFRQHAGYGTAYHRAALLAAGPCPVHRRSVRPVREIIAARGHPEARGDRGAAVAPSAPPREP